jgi:hypothetical protein
LPGWARAAAFLCDGSIVVLGGGQSIRILDATTGAVRHELKPDEERQGERWLELAVAPNGDALLIGGIDAEKRGFVEVWEVGREFGDPRRLNGKSE